MKTVMNSWRCTLNERMRILKLLEEGKINADEAARLLEALSLSETRERRKHRVWTSIEAIPDRIASAINHSFATTFHDSASKEELQFSMKKAISFNGISGDLEIVGEDRDNIIINKDGFAKITESDGTLEIKALSGDVRITTPRTTDVTIKGISGDLMLSGLDNETHIASVSGDIQGTELSGTFIGDFVSGDVDLAYDHIQNMTIKSKSGDIVLRLKKEAQVALDIATGSGSIECALPLSEEERTDNTLKGIINKATGKVKINSEHGDIEIVEKE
jgi:DUF4097 and DUF4098 domain-containing protein YvlB